MATTATAVCSAATVLRKRSSRHQRQKHTQRTCQHHFTRHFHDGTPASDEANLAPLAAH
jgi:hypothetical protein